MQSLILIFLMQAAMGEPAEPANGAIAEPPAAETPVTQPATRTERRRVCESPGAATGGRIALRRCRWEEVEVPVEEAEAAEEEAAGGAPAQGAQAPNAE